ncbi:hypothetical protein JKF63_02225 [Porcisia hertigi]|uniref:Uncharacterized protein n=1 Tax=Porcisia hertigi TaxID=2761500 RepID=A0A836L5B8_9TRYP|nr:hypothetical protein JKF63_02225 [Porcisia hertigi]
MSAGRLSVDAAPPHQVGGTTRSTMSKPPLAPVPPPPPLPATDAPFSLDGFLANFSGVPAPVARETPGGPQQNSRSHHSDTSMYAPFASREGGSDVLDFFFSAAASDTPCVSGSANSASPGLLVADNISGGESGGRLNFDFASFFLQAGQDGSCPDDGPRAAGSGDDARGTDTCDSEGYIRCEAGNMAHSTGEENALPTRSFSPQDDQVASALANDSFVSHSTAWGLESATANEKRYAPLPPQVQQPEALMEAVAESEGGKTTRTVPQQGASLMTLKSSEANASPVDQAPVKKLPREHISSSAMNQTRSLAAALAAAPSPPGLLAGEEAQRKVAPALLPNNVEETEGDGAKARLAADYIHPESAAFDDSIRRNMAEEEATAAPVHSRPSSSPGKPPVSLLRGSYSPGVAETTAPAVTPTPQLSPSRALVPLRPLLSTSYRPQPSVPIEMASGDATGMALRKAMSEAEEVWAHGLDMGWINSSEAHKAEAGMSTTDFASSSSSDAVFFSEAARLQQQAVQLGEESAQSTASLQALTSDLLRILGPHAALSSLVGEQYATTPLVHLPWALIEVLEGLLKSDTSSEEEVGEGGGAVTETERAEKPSAAPPPSSDSAAVGCNSSHDV